ncbi:hypothetical protein [Streptomyces sp. NPDC005573]|uniref:hypothetical protein n=1 Tax=Streptomyces sp. NPDC005573 TaxID=3156890 RepID=UPI0033B57C7F
MSPMFLTLAGAESPGREFLYAAVLALLGGVALWSGRGRRRAGRLDAVRDEVEIPAGRPDPESLATVRRFQGAVQLVVGSLLLAGAAALALTALAQLTG